MNNVTVTGRAEKTKTTDSWHRSGRSNVLKNLRVLGNLCLTFTEGLPLLSTLRSARGSGSEVYGEKSLSCRDPKLYVQSKLRLRSIPSGLRLHCPYSCTHRRQYCLYVRPYIHEVIVISTLLCTSDVCLRCNERVYDLAQL